MGMGDMVTKDMATVTGATGMGAMSMATTITGMDMVTTDMGIGMAMAAAGGMVAGGPTVLAHAGSGHPPGGFGAAIDDLRQV